MVLRVSNNQIETDLPERESLEACWRVFNKRGFKSCVIDSDRREVQGTMMPKSFRNSYHRIITARLEDNLEYRLISLSVDLVNDPTARTNSRFVNRLTKDIIAELNISPNIPLATTVVDKAPPIPSPRGGPTPQFDAPVYGVVVPFQPAKPRHGAILFLCGFLGLFAVVFGIVAVVGGGLALKSYSDDSSQRKAVTFDKVLTVLGMLLGSLGIWMSLARM